MAYRRIYPVADGVVTTTNGVTATQYPVITTNGNYPTDAGFLYSGGTGTVEVFGTFGTGTATLQMRGIDRVTWIPIGSAITANSVTGFVLGERFLRVAITGATGAALYCAITRVDS